jgi:hypothetical protein
MCIRQKSKSQIQRVVGQSRQLQLDDACLPGKKKQVIIKALLPRRDIPGLERRYLYHAKEGQNHGKSGHYHGKEGQNNGKEWQHHVVVVVFLCCKEGALQVQVLVNFL